MSTLGSSISTPSSSTFTCSGTSSEWLRCVFCHIQNQGLPIYSRQDRISPLAKLATHSRFFLTLRSQEGEYHSLILFRLTPGQLPENGSELGEDASDSLQSLREQIYVMEANCPHLGAVMSHAEIEECDTGFVAVCPWHRLVQLFLTIKHRRKIEHSAGTTLTSKPATARLASRLVRTPPRSGKMMAQNTYTSSPHREAEIGAW